ncbi:MAG: hypothetical protein GY841_12370 [FCB group bacterium]|nr:hypothetical protein [FCB group bacterium]
MTLKKLSATERAIQTIDAAIKALKLERDELAAMLPIKSKSKKISFKNGLTGQKRHIKI